MQKILITGVTGFIGHNIAKEFYAKYSKYDITIIGRKTKSWNDRLIKKNIKYIDLYKDNLEQLGKFDCIIHCAAILDNKKIDYPWNEYYNNNVLVLNKILNSIKFKRLIFISSGSVFSSNNSFPNPNNYYGLSKYVSEKILEIFSLKSKIQIIIIRFPIVIGLNSINNLVAMFAKVIFKNNPIEIYGNGKLKRNIIHIDEVVKIIIKLCFKKKYKNNIEIINAGSSSSMNIIDIALLIKKMLKSKSIITKINKKRRADYNSKVNLNKIKKILGYKPITTRKSIVKFINQKY